MKIGIVGSEGVVGSALKFGFEMPSVGHDVYVHDIKLGTSIKNIINTEIVFICVPTPSNEDGSCDTSIVELCIKEIVEYYNKNNIEQKPILCIKSTVEVGTTKKLQQLFPYNECGIHICFCPEFLKERSAKIDFTERMDLLVVGTEVDIVYDKIVSAHKGLIKQDTKVFKVSPNTAEMIKYANNAFGAMLVVFANSFFELCEKYNVEYSNMKNILVNRSFIPNEYLECGNKWRGYDSICWNKDIPALVKMSENTKVEFFKNIINENDKYTKIPAPNTRTKY